MSMRSIVLLLAVFVAWPAQAQPSPRCVVALTEAEADYLEGRFAEAVALLEACLDGATRAPAEARPVYRLLALALLQQDRPDAAREAVGALLRLDPGYAADPVMDPPSYQRLVARTREDMPPAPEAEDVAQEVADEAEVEPEAAAPRLVERTAPAAVAVPARSVEGAETTRPWFRQPRGGLVAIGGALVVGAAAAMLLGGDAAN